MKRHLGIVLLAAVIGFALSACKKADTSQDWTAVLLGGSAFTDLFNGTVQDSTGLTWIKCAVGQVYTANSLNNCTGSGAATTYNAQSKAYCPIEAACTGTNLEANDGEVYNACNTLSTAGTGWRVPTIYELSAFSKLLNRDGFLQVFPQTPDDKPFWSGTQNSSDATGKTAKTVSFADSTFGQSDTLDKYSGKAYVRCVR